MAAPVLLEATVALVARPEPVALGAGLLPVAQMALTAMAAMAAMAGTAAMEPMAPLAPPV